MTRRERQQRILEMLRAGKTKTAISKALGCHLSVVGGVIKKHFPGYQRQRGGMPPTKRAEDCCALCLLGVGFGNKYASRFSGVPLKVVKRIARTTDEIAFNDKRASGALGLRDLKEHHIRDAQVEAFEGEQRLFKRGDESTHWGNHPSLAMWAYYRDHEKSKRISLENAKKRWANATPEMRVVKSLRHRTWAMVKKQGAMKSQRTLELLGCDWPTLKLHIELQFKPGMTWDNYGKWHLDHKRPCASYDLTSEFAQLECFYYKNLQPMWGADNRSKSSKFNGLH